MRIRRLYLTLHLISCLLLVQIPTSSSAQDHTMWTNLGIFGGSVQDITVDPGNPSRIFAATYLGRGLFLSEDGGDTWQALEMENTIDGEDTFNEHSVYAVAIANSNPDVVWVGHNYWLAKSTDGGRTWTHLSNSSVQRDCASCGGTYDAWRLCRSIVIDPVNPDIVYMGAGGPSSGDTDGAVYGTTDGGATWHKLNGGNNLDYRVEDLAVSPSNPAVIWAVTNSNGSGGGYDGTVYRSDDWGQTFTPIDPKPATGGILAVAPKPDSPDTVFVTGGYGIVQLTYDGSAWAAGYPVSESRMAADITFAPSDADIVYAAWMRPDDAFWLGDGRPKVSKGAFDGSTWTWETIAPDPQNITALQVLAVHPTNSDIILGGDMSLGMVRSQDAGQNWTPINEGIDAVIVYDVDVDDYDTDHLLAASGSGLYERQDGSSAWIRRHQGIFRAAKFQPSSSSIYFGGGYGYVARTSDNGVNWTYSNSLGPVYIHDIVIDPLDTLRLYITTGHYGRQVLRSVDGGANFQSILDGINLAGQPYSMNKVTLDPRNNQRILAAGGNFYSPYVAGDLWESLDGGDTWERTGLTDTVVNAVIVDPRYSDVLYAGCGYSQNYVEPVVKSTDGGATWETVTTGIPPARRSLYSIWGPSDQDLLYVVGRFGYITRYNGEHWEVQESNTDNTLYGVFGVSADDIYAVGGSGIIVHYDGQVWSAMTSNTSQNLYKVWAADNTHVYAVGQGGIILHYDGSGWTEMTSPTTEDLYEIRGITQDDVFAAGVGGTILHYDGGGWQTMTSGTTTTLDALWAFSGSDVFAVGDSGVILRYNGSNWTAMQSHITGNLWAVWGGNSSNVYAAGPDGHLLHYNGQQWEQIDLNPEHLYQEIWGDESDRLYLTDSNSVVWRYDGQQITASREHGTYKRTVTDLAIHRSNPDILYAATYGAGVYISPNQASNWLNLGTPANSVFAIASGSLYAATGGGMNELTGTGVIAGEVSDADTLLGIDAARVATDLGNQCLSIEGEYMMVVPAGIFDVDASAENYEAGRAENITVIGSDVTWQNFALKRENADTPDDPDDDPVPPEEDDNPDSDNGSGGGGPCFIGALSL